MHIPEALTFDDVLLTPGYTEVLPNEVSVRARLTKDITLNIPLLSAAMDTVTEARMAIALAREGGLGVIHRNMSVDRQAEEVDKVKRSESGMIVDPITLPPEATIAEAEALMQRYRISGVPITRDQVLVGILTNRDIRFLEPADFGRPVSEYMTSGDLITAPVGTTLDEAKAILARHRIEKLPLVDSAGHLKGLITVKDIQKNREYPNAALDASGRLLCAAAIGVGDAGVERARALIDAGVDVIFIDTAHGHSKGVLETIPRVKRLGDVCVVAGNVVTSQGVEDLARAGADAVKVGVGAGSICTTRVVAGAGMPQITAIFQCFEAATKYDIPLIADGGMRYSGDIVKALAAGASTVMLGSLFAGLDESPGEVVLYEGRRFKDYRGMGSLGAMQGAGRDRYGSGQAGGKTVPEGIEGRVPYKGNLHDYVYQMVGGLRSGMGYVGARSLDELRQKAKFVRVSHAGLIESHPHDVIITKEAPNYYLQGS
ncbi:MAG: IMP dehydrogenase [Candidatus Roseilinea sp.]|uniref:IMP dehydrogenase n=1 Tax=Candidatus Roseilinea sp. TaxID=2838777 RepID=UPI00404A8E6C